MKRERTGEKEKEEMEKSKSNIQEEDSDKMMRWGKQNRDKIRR